MARQYQPSCTHTLILEFLISKGNANQPHLACCLFYPLSVKIWDK